MSLGMGTIISVGGGSGGSGGSTSGITSLNGQTGPAVVITGVNGIDVTAAGNVIIVDGAGASGAGGGGSSKFAASFISITSGLFTHSLNTRDVLIQVYDASGPPRQITPDDIILDNLDQISLVFNVPQTGRVVIIG